MTLRLFVLTLLLGITVAAAAADTKDEIDHLMAFIADSPCTFIRNGRPYEAEEAGQHIKRKYDYIVDRITTAEEFIAYAATESSLSGEPYRVACSDGDQTSADWLTAELNRYRNQADSGAVSTP